MMHDPGAVLAVGVTKIMSRVVERPEIRALVRLSGGANMESWSFDCSDAGFVLRRAPSAEMMASRPISHQVEARIIRAVCAAGVRAPEIVAELQPEDGLGSGFVMRRVQGEVAPGAILSAPPPSLLHDLARELAQIHKTPLSSVNGAPTLDAAEGVAELKAKFLAFGGDRPILALAIRWLETNLPEPSPPALVHGDFRIGNLIVAHEGLAAVLDWELAHIGDTHEDLAFGCMTVWRFGHIDRPAFGLGALEEFFSLYEAESGTKVEIARFGFWLVYRTVWWALVCLNMGALWRSKADRSMERVVVARRTSESELDLLLLLEGEAPPAERARSLPTPAPSEPEFVGEPAVSELLTAVSEWLDSDIKPRSHGRDKFLVAVAMNALGMARRDLQRPHGTQDADLAQSFLDGRATLATPGLLARLRRDALDKLSADAPKYAALAHARSLWRE